MKNNENGRSMVEMLGVLAIIGVLSAGGLAGYSKAMYKYRVNETMNQLTMIVSNIRTLFGSQNTYAGLTTANAYEYGIVTADMTEGTDHSTLKNPFKGAIKVEADMGRKAGDNEAFYIQYDNLPAEACVTIVTSDWGSAAGSGLVGIAAVSNGTADAGGHDAATVTASLNKADGTADTSKTLSARPITESVSTPFTIATAVDICNPASGDTSRNASVALKYY